MYYLDTAINNYNDNNKYRYGKKRFLVFIKRGNPFYNDNIVDDIVWRRIHNAPMTRKVMQEVLQRLGIFEKWGITDLTKVSITYSKKAGCSMCPCSPGYVVSVRDEHASVTPAVWLIEEHLSAYEQIVGNLRSAL